MTPTRAVKSNGGVRMTRNVVGWRERCGGWRAAEGVQWDQLVPPGLQPQSAGHLMVEDRAREKREHLDRGERKECQHGLVVVAQEANGSHESPVAASQQKLQRSQHTSTTAGGCSQTSGVACREGHPDGLIRLPALPGCEWPGALCAARADLTDSQQSVCQCYKPRAMPRRHDAGRLPVVVPDLLYLWNARVAAATETG
jgi:hypothetical protein